MTRSTLATAATVSLLFAISGAAYGQGVGGTPPGSNPTGTMTTPRTNTGGAPTGLSPQNSDSMSSPTGAAPTAEPSAVILPHIDKMTPAQIQAGLQSNGFDNVRNLKKQGQAYNATATKDGQPVKLQIDASSGRVTTTNN